MSNTTLSGFDGGRTVSPAIQTAMRLIKELNSRGIQMEPRAFKVTKTEPERLKFKLAVEGIPYIELKLKDTILVSKENLMECWSLENSDPTNGTFLQEYNSQELELVVKNHPTIRDKSIVSIKNMNPAEAGLFLQKCNRIKKGLLLESEKNANGNFNINIPAGLLNSKEKVKLEDAYLQTQIEISGINSASKTKTHIDLSIENYRNAVKERRMVNSMSKLIRSKLISTGTMPDDFGAYMKSLKMQLGYIIESLQKGAEPNGFEKLLLEKTIKAYHFLPDGTYKYTSSYLKNQQITSRQAMAQSVDLTSKSVTVQREVI